MDRTPCNGRTTLFEPYFLQDETDDQRSHRLSLALSVCGGCPLKRKNECLERGLTTDLAEGVWGGTVIVSEIDQGKDCK
ncbi:MAG: WhiB family transcriptional regulator [Alphaproteobacteria bacterium]|nr:WhiB family transcriptional regulator [Alphaproteobacteria bacterium]